MSGPVGRITAAFASLRNENSLSLANLNLDFALVKLDVPKEFLSVGDTISRKRKAIAEDGSLHKTARRLGALFGSRLPKTDALFRAYGTRVSEIADLPSVNPLASARDGIFENDVGLDTASIWAAVTSGASAISVHLLACMLARMFTGPEAISVWVEIVERQKQELLKDITNELYPEEYHSPLIAAQQDITRAELANWDASARAWLQSADQAKAKEHDLLKVVLEEADIPVKTDRDVFRSVLSAWRVALIGMNSLLEGQPQQVQDGAALVGMSSWHLYPDMNVLGRDPESVEQNDNLFKKRAILTLGLQSIRGGSVSWSLPLAKLQHYGHSVNVSRSAKQENSRVTIDQFGFIVLGCFFASWQSFGHDTITGLRWLRTLSMSKQFAEDYQNLHHRSENDRRRIVSVVKYLHRSANLLEECEGVEAQIAQQLLSLGGRRAQFLSPCIGAPKLFGFADFMQLLPMLKTSEDRVHLLRELSSYQGLTDFGYVIQLKNELATVRPISSRVMETSDYQASVSRKEPLKNGRWLVLNAREIKLISRAMEVFEPTMSERFRDIFSRHNQIVKMGEFCLPCLDIGKDMLGVPRLIFQRGFNFMDAIINLAPIANYYQGGGARQAITTNFHVAKFEPIMGIPDIGQICLFSSLKAKMSISDMLLPDKYHSQFVPKRVDENILIGKLCHLLDIDTGSHLFRSLEACVEIARIYKLLPNATISTLVLSQPLMDAQWIPRLGKSSTLSRSQTFACIAMFDSGMPGLDPNLLTRVFAMSTGNSIFVASPMLCDPYESPDSTEIRRVVGNIGKPGISFLLPPPDPHIREPDVENWTQINHFKFDGTLCDSFRHTSIHLSFTTYELPLSTESGKRHIIDKPANLVETLVTVYDRKDWIADLDILAALENIPRSEDQNIRRLSCPTETEPDTEPKILYEKFCNTRPRASYAAALEIWPELEMKCVDNWDELLESPGTGNLIIRAQNNWLSRLALISFFEVLSPIPSQITYRLRGKEPANFIVTTNYNTNATKMNI